MPSSPHAPATLAAHKIWDAAVKKNLTKAKKAFKPLPTPRPAGESARATATAGRTHRAAVRTLNQAKKQNLRDAARALAPKKKKKPAVKSGL